MYLISVALFEVSVKKFFNSGVCSRFLPEVCRTRACVCRNRIKHTFCGFILYKLRKQPIHWESLYIM